MEGCGLFLIIAGIVAALFMFLPWPIALMIIIGFVLVGISETNKDR